MKVTNKTRFITQDLRLITCEVLSKIYKTNLSFDRVDFISNNKRREIDVICINYFDSNITVGIPRALQKNSGNAETVNRLMSYMYYYFFLGLGGKGRIRQFPGVSTS